MGNHRCSVVIRFQICIFDILNTAELSTIDDMREL